jgi:hypothetical protein
MQHTIEKQERLPLFKVVWGTLSQLMTTFPAQMRIETNPISIMIPIFHKVDFFCQSNSPSGDMLSFLTIVFSDVKALLTLRNNALEYNVGSNKGKLDDF